MPVTLKHILPGGGTLALWKIDEDEHALAQFCTPQELAQAATFATTGRRCEYLAWHALLHTLLPGATASHDAVGGPVLLPAPHRGGPVPETPSEAAQNPAPTHIGVSHTREYAAVIVAPHPCAVDIELTSRDFSRAARRFISPAEEALRPATMPQERFRAFIWCAKESAYKWARQEGLDLLQDIQIVSVAPEPSKFPEPQGQLELNAHSQYLLNTPTIPNTPCAASTPHASDIPNATGLTDTAETPHIPHSPHNIELSVAGEPLTLHGFLFGDLCCVYGVK